MKDWKLPPIDLQWKEKLEEYKYVILVIGLGLFFLLLPTSEKTEEVQQNPSDINVYLKDFETHLAENLSLIQGAGETQVVLTLKNNGEKILAQDIQIDPQGKSTKETVTIGNGNSQQVIEIQQDSPEFQGALIICKGGDNPTVKLELIQAVSALTGLRSDNITVCKSKS